MHNSAARVIWGRALHIERSQCLDRHAQMLVPRRFPLVWDSILRDGWMDGWMDGWLDMGFWESVDYSPLCLQVRFLILSVGCKGRYVCSIVLLTCLEHGR